jgi:ATP-dependent DNA helicase DinG
VAGLSDSHRIWPQVTSTRDNCLGNRCEEFKRCHLVAARREAQEADIVIVNHHLLLADLALKEDGFGDLLGSADAVILDEAHQLPDLATQFFGASIGSRRIENVLKEIGVEAQATPSRTVAAVHAVEESLRDLTERLPRGIGRISWGEMPTPIDRPASELAESLQVLATELSESAQGSVALTQLAERTSELAVGVERIASVDESEGARAVETFAKGFTLHLIPFDIAERFQSLVQSRRCSWVFTSATLSIGEDFTHFTSRLGLTEAATLRIDSPFDYESQSLLYLPKGLPQPAAPGFVPAMLDLSIPLIEASRGGAFLLFTSHRALAQGAALLRAHWGLKPPYNLYVQGEAPRELLLKAFREDGNGVLLGTSSFWEGVDVKGSALRLVIIDKLPFASPDDPLVKARVAHIQASGGNAFMDYQLPEAALALKQGVGRLIRSEEDFGVVVICDRRIVDKPYGRVFRSALPAMSLAQEPDEVTRFLKRHSPSVEAA